MSGHWNQHIGNDQLVYGMPKHMSAVAGSGNEAAYWRYHPKPQACDKCQAMKGLWFDENPGPVHPNCKCEIEEFRATKVTGRADGVLVPPEVDIATNIAEARQKAKDCEQQATKEVDDFLSRINLNGVHAIASIRRTCIDELTFLNKCLWIYRNFKNGARYDFKQRGKE